MHFPYQNLILVRLLTHFVCMALQEVEGICSPIISKMYGQGGAAPGGDFGGGGMPDFGGEAPGAGASSGPGPKIEEVD